MTDYYLITLYQESVTLQNDILINYISVVFAFLLAGYLVAEKLKFIMAILIVILFSAVSGFFFIELHYLRNDLVVLAVEMALRVSNSEFMLPNLAMAQLTDGGKAMGSVLDLATYGSYFGALIFFFYQRNQRTKTI